jgi:hypothetical protein
MGRRPSGDPPDRAGRRRPPEAGREPLTRRWGGANMPSPPSQGLAEAPRARPGLPNGDRWAREGGW